MLTNASIRLMSTRLLPLWISQLVLAGTFLTNAKSICAQNPGPSVTSDTMTPTPGVGHAYQQLLSESIDPSSGSVSLAINIPAPRARGITLPFGFDYSSAGAIRLNADTTLNWQVFSEALGGTGWHYRIPNAKYSGWTTSIPVNGSTGNIEQAPTGGGEIGCSWFGNYTLQDLAGATHNLNLTIVNATPGPDGTGGGYPQSCNGIFSTSGGDAQVIATYPPNVKSSTANGNFDPSTFSVSDENNTRYFFHPQNLFYILNNVAELFPETIEDRNGNILALSYPRSPSGSAFPLTVTDSVGRALTLSRSGTVDTISIGGSTYQTQWTTVGASYSVANLITPGSSTYNCSKVSSVPSVSAQFRVASSLKLPNGTSYQFFYGENNPSDTSILNPYGLINEVIYPSGAWIKYTWKLSDNYSTFGTFQGYDQNGNVTGPYCGYYYASPVLAIRQASFDGSSVAKVDSYTYTTTWINQTGADWASKETQVASTDNITNQLTTNVITYQPLGGYYPNAVTTRGKQIPVESSILTFAGSRTGSPLLTETKAWSSPLTLACDFTTNAGGLTSGKFYTYDLGSLPTDVKEYGYGQIKTPASACSGYQPIAPSSPNPIRETTVQYAFGQPCQSIYYDSSHSRVAETDVYLDGGTSPCVFGSVATQEVPNLVAGTHDEINYGVNTTASSRRGNPTSVTKWNDNGDNSVVSAVFDKTGQMVSSVDACGYSTCTNMISGGGHTTSYSYKDSFIDGGPANGASNAYLTSVTRPSPNGIAMTQQTSYRFVDGQVSSSTDVNSQTTNYLYSDLLHRLTNVQGPADTNNGGLRASLSYTYVDSPVTGPSSTTPNVTVTQLLNLDKKNKITVTTLDGAGRTVRISNDSDPEGSSIVDSTYTGAGLLRSVSNPYRLLGDPTYGITTFTYDVLGRTVSKSYPDGSAELWCFDNNSGSGKICNPTRSSSANVSWVDYLDEVGNHSQSIFDAFGNRLSQFQSDPIGGGLTVETDYSYDSLNRLRGVQERGIAGDTVRSRVFTYDSLGHLLTSNNPETGTICYGKWNGGSVGSGMCKTGYDVNGNLQSKTDARGVITNYIYDSLNRLLSKTYEADSTGTASSCLQYDTSAVPGSGSNFIGRVTNTWTQKGPCSTQPNLQSPITLSRRSIISYDVAGRVLTEQQCTLANCKGGVLYAPIYDYDLVGNVIHHTDGIGRLTLTNCFGSANQLSMMVGVYTSCSSPSFPANAKIFTTPTYSAFGALSNVTLGNGILLKRAYDSRLRVTSEIDTGSTTPTVGAGEAIITLTGSDLVH